MKDCRTILQKSMLIITIIKKSNFFWYVPLGHLWQEKWMFVVVKSDQTDFVPTLSCVKIWQGLVQEESIFKYHFNFLQVGPLKSLTNFLWIPAGEYPNNLWWQCYLNLNAIFGIAKVRKYHTWHGKFQRQLSNGMLLLCLTSRSAFFDLPRHIFPKKNLHDH